MADDVDLTNERMEQLHQLAMTNRARTVKPIPDSGLCFFCDTIIPVGKFCDKDCQDDYQKEQYMLSQRPR